MSLVISGNAETWNLNCALIPMRSDIRMNNNTFNLISSFQCTPIVGHGFVLDKYRCQCRKGFYHPSRVALNGYKGKCRIFVRRKNMPWKVSEQNFWAYVFSWQTHFFFVWYVPGVFKWVSWGSRGYETSVKGSWLAFPWKQQRVASESWDLWDLWGL